MHFAILLINAMTFITALLWAEKQRWWKFEDRDEVNNPLETDP